MNHLQLIEQLQTFGLEPESDFGHVVCLMDTWTGRVLSAVLHPDPDNRERSLTIVIASAKMDSYSGKLIAGAAPTTVGDSFDSWTEIANKAMREATLVSTSYVMSFYDRIGFDLAKFMEGPGKDMTPDARHRHLDSRLEYAVSRSYVNAVASASMDVLASSDNSLREASMSGLDLAYSGLDQAEAMLRAVDGQ